MHAFARGDEFHHRGAFGFGETAGRRCARNALVEKFDRYAQDAGDFIEASGADPVDAFFVFLDLLKWQAEQLFLTHSDQHTPDTHTVSDLSIDRIGLFLGHNSHIQIIAGRELTRIGQGTERNYFSPKAASLSSVPRSRPARLPRPAATGTANHHNAHRVLAALPRVVYARLSRPFYQAPIARQSAHKDQSPPRFRYWLHAQRVTPLQLRAPAQSEDADK